MSSSGVYRVGRHGRVPPPAPGSTPSVAARPALNGVFTSAQAARGEQRFKQACATCHSIEEQAGSLRSKWGNGTLRDLFTAISTTMPQNNPGSLSPEDYASILAFYLQQSGHSPGSTDLPGDLCGAARHAHRSSLTSPGRAWPCRMPCQEVSYLPSEAEPRSLSASARMANAVAVSDMNNRRHGSPFSPPCSRS